MSEIVARIEGVTVAQSDQDAVERWLGTWEVASPLRPYDELALAHGDETERALTETLIGDDLRQLVYDSRAVFWRPCPASAELLTAWEEEKGRCHCDGFCPLPFLRAIWRVKPKLLALPAGWVTEGQA